MKITTARMALIPKHFNCNVVIPVLNPFSPEEKNRESASHSKCATYNLRFENFLKCDVWVCFRNGVYTKVVKSVGIKSTTAFVVTVDQSFNIQPSQNEINIDMLDSYGSLTDNPTTATTAVQKGLLTRIQNRKAGVVGNTVRYYYTEEEIGADPNGVYLEELDVVVSLVNNFPNILHPHSDAGRRHSLSMTAMQAENEKTANIGLNFFIRIVDNESNYSPRFIKLGNNVFAVPSIVDSRQADGVYVGGSEPVDGQRNTERRSKYYKMEEADTLLPLFKTVEEAQAAPESVFKDAETAFQKETLQFKRDQLTQSSEELREKAEEARRRAEVEAERIKFERERLREEAMRREHDSKIRQEHEARQSRQSYRNEIIEVGKLVVAVAGFYFAYLKLKK